MRPLRAFTDRSVFICGPKSGLLGVDWEFTIEASGYQKLMRVAYDSSSWYFHTLYVRINDDYINMHQTEHTGVQIAASHITSEQVAQHLKLCLQEFVTEAFYVMEMWGCGEIIPLLGLRDFERFEYVGPFEADLDQAVQSLPLHRTVQ